MPFRTILADLVAAVPGATGAILVDWEGEAVEQVCHFDEFEMKLIGAHKGIVLNRLREIHGSVGGGDVENFTISTASQCLLVAPVGPDYLLVMTLDRTALQGVARYRATMAVEMLKKEIC